MPNSVLLSNAQTRCRNPASVCSSSAGSAPMSAWYQGPLTPRSRTVSATWLSAGKAIVGSSLFTTIHATRRARCHRAAPGSLEIIDPEADERENPLKSEQLFTTAAANFILVCQFQG